MSRRERKPTLVKVIHTEFVQTDPQNFKAVVQNLTGKDSRIPGISAEKPVTSQKMAYYEEPGQQDLMRVSEDDGGLKPKTWLMEDFRWLMELPPLDEQEVRSHTKS